MLGAEDLVNDFANDNFAKSKTSLMMIYFPVMGTH